MFYYVPYFLFLLCFFVLGKRFYAIQFISITFLSIQCSCYRKLYKFTKPQPLNNVLISNLIFLCRRLLKFQQVEQMKAHGKSRWKLYQIWNITSVVLKTSLRKQFFHDTDSISPTKWVFHLFLFLSLHNEMRHIIYFHQTFFQNIFISWLSSWTSKKFRSTWYVCFWNNVVNERFSNVSCFCNHVGTLWYNKFMKYVKLYKLYCNQTLKLYLSEYKYIIYIIT